ncbi:MAG: hypothetical protein ACYSPI_02535, partial [Planctomycetota bacterium]
MNLLNKSAIITVFGMRGGFLFNQTGVVMRLLMSCRVVVLVLFFGIFTVSAFAGSEILINPSFEDGDLGQFGSVTIPGWSTVRTQGFHHDESGSVIGVKAIKVTTNTVIRQDFPVTSGDEYVCSVKMLSSSLEPLNQALAILVVKWYDGV